MHERHRYARIAQTYHRDKDAARTYQPLMRDLAKFAAPGATTDIGQRMTMAMLRGPMRTSLERTLAFNVKRRKMADAQRAFQTLMVTVDDLASDRTLDVEFPAANGVCTARSLARLYAALIGPIDGGVGNKNNRPVISADVVGEAAARHAYGEDRVLHATTAFGLGFMLPGTMQFDEGWGERAFGHPGNGGAIGIADPERGLAIGYVRKRITQLVRNDTTNALLGAVYRCL